MDKYDGSLEEEETLSRLRELKVELLESAGERKSPIQRRLKVDVFKDTTFPDKVVHSAHRTCGLMPERQALMYKNEHDRVNRGEIKILQGLHAWKRISLAPRPFDTWLEGSDAFIKDSGRLIEFFKILDSVSEAREKALIFLENRELQPILAQVLKERYALRKIPFAN